MARKTARSILFVVQENWLFQGWKDHASGPYDNVHPLYEERKANSIWWGEPGNRRKWRLVRRTVVDTVLEG